MSKHPDLRNRTHPRAPLLQPLEPRLLLSATLPAFAPARRTFASLDCSCDPTPFAPKAPYRLSAQATSPTSVFLRWSEDSSETVDYFRLGRLDPGGRWQTIAYLDADTEHYTDTDVQPGNVYAYRVVAVNDGGASHPSATRTVTLSPDTDPTLVGNFGHLPGGPFTAPLTFTDTDGTFVKIRLTGPGAGTLHLTADGYTLSLLGTSGNSTLAITTRRSKTPLDDGRFTLAALTLSNPDDLADATSLASLSAPTTDLAGTLRIPGTLGHLRLGNVNTGSSLSIANHASAALTLATATISGTVTGSTWSITGNVGTLSIAGAVATSDIRTTGSINTFTAATLDHPRLFAGLLPTLTALPTSAADFLNPAATIGKIILRGPYGNSTSPVLINADIAAPQIRQVTLPARPSAIADDDATTPFGFATATGSILHYTGPAPTTLYLTGTAPQ